MFVACDFTVVISLDDERRFIGIVAKLKRPLSGRVLIMNSRQTLGRRVAKIHRLASRRIDGIFFAEGVTSLSLAVFTIESTLRGRAGYDGVRSTTREIPFRVVSTPSNRFIYVAITRFFHTKRCLRLIIVAPP